MRLTIAIPTFNRNHLLPGAVERLLPQLGDHELLVVDNACDVPVSDTLAALRGARGLRVERNPVNVGGAANILRCLELCRTEWLYCLGDDDVVAEDCVARIEASIAEHPQALYFSFSRPVMRRRSTFAAEGLAGFVDALVDWSTFLFMSSSVVNAAELRPHIRWGYLYAYSWAPMQAALLKRLGSGGRVVFSERILCPSESLSDETWLPFAVAAGRMVLPELVDDPALRRALAAKLVSQPSLLALVYWARVKGEGPRLEQNRFLLGLYFARVAGYRRSVRLAAVRLLAAVLLRRWLVPDPVFHLFRTVAFRLMGRTVPGSKAMSEDRT